MNRTNQIAGLMLFFSLAPLVLMFARPLGLSIAWQLLICVLLLGAIALYFFLIRKINRGMSGKPTVPIPADRRKKLFGMVAASLALGLFGGLPLMPYLVYNFQPWFYWTMVPLNIIVLAVFLTWYWSWLNKVRVPSHTKSGPENPK